MNNKIILISVAVLIAIAAFAYFKFAPAKQEPEKAEEQVLVSLKPQINNDGGVSIEAAPDNFNPGEPVRFNISIDTHQGDLDFDLAQDSVLIGGSGKEYYPLEWQGGRGGHHLSGVLTFSSLSEEEKNFTLIIKNVYGVKERVFKWEL